MITPLPPVVPTSDMSAATLESFRSELDIAKSRGLFLPAEKSVFLACCSFLLDHFYVDHRPTLCWWHSSFWLYDPTLNGGSWSEVADDEIRARFTEWYVSLPNCPNFALNNNTRATALSLLKDLTRTAIPSIPHWRLPVVSHLQSLDILGDAPLPDPSDCISFTDCILDLGSYIRGDGPLTDFTRERHAEYFDPNLINTPLSAILPYDPVAQCPTWLSFLNSSLEGDVELITLLQRWFGYCLLPHCRLQKFLFMFGVSRSGKSTVLRILTKMLGPDACGSTNLRSLGSSHGLEGFERKRHMALPDASPAAFIQMSYATENLKSIIGNDPVVINPKNVRQKLNVTLPTKVTLISNDIPHFDNSGSAMSNRMVILPFRKSFAGLEDTFLDSKLEAELPGITRWALQGAIAVLRAELAGQPVFPQPMAAQRADRLFRTITNPHEVFFRDCLQPSKEPNHFISHADIYASYLQWLDDEELLVKPLGLKGLVQRMTIAGLGQRHRNPAGEYGRTGLEFTDKAPIVPGRSSCLETPLTTPTPHA